MTRSSPRVGDLVQLTGHEWDPHWLQMICIVIGTYPAARSRGQTRKRWRVLAESGDLLVIVKEDVTVLQALDKTTI